MVFILAGSTNSRSPCQCEGLAPCGRKDELYQGVAISARFWYFVICCQIYGP